jgi:LysM repeat protein
MVPLGIGLLGLVIGAIALFMSFSNSSKITQLNTLSDTVAATAAKADAAKAAADSASGKIDADASAIAALRSAAQDAFNKIQDTINQHTTELAALKSGGGRTASAGSKGSSSAETPPVGPNGGVHVIAPGDNFSTIARKYGVTLSSLQDANPGVDSTKLRPGQKITIPPPSSKSGASRPAPTSAPSGASGPATAVTP